MSQPCGCCGGIQIVTPQPEINSAGLTALSYRVGNYATFFETMVARLSNLYLDIPAPDGIGPIQRIYPLQRLTTREPSDPAIALLDTWAVVADVLTFYQERIANEGYLLTATERRSLLELARLVGYRLRPGVAASVYLAFTVATGFDGTLPAGTRAQSIPASGGSPQFFETSADLTARDVWNALQPRLTRPQIIAWGGAPGIAPASLHTLYAQGLSTNLKPGDRLVISTSDFSGNQALRAIAAVNLDSPNQRTQLVLRDHPPGKFLEVAERYAAESATLFPGSDLAAQVATLLIGLVPNIDSTGTLDASDLDGAIGQIQQVEVIAATRQFTRLDAWLSDLITELDSLADPALSANANLGRAPGSPPKVTVGGKPVSLGLQRLGEVVEQLALPPSLQPAGPTALVRRVSDVYAPQSDIAPRLLAQFHPLAASSLYQAWGSIAQPPTQVEIFAARVKAGIFANSFAGFVTSTQSGQTVTPPVLGDAVGDLVDSNGNLSTVPLDAVYDQIRVGSWVAIDWPASGGPQFFRVTNVATVSRETVHAPPTTDASGAAIPGASTTPVPSGFAAKVTQVTLDTPWLTGLSATSAPLNASDALRNTVIYAQTEELALAEEPLDRDVEGSTIELDSLYDGLESGRWVIVQGTRTDIPNTTGVTASELVMIGAVTQGGPGQQACMPVTISQPPFRKIYYITPANSAGDQLVVGEPGVGFENLLSNFPLANQAGHQPICGTFQVAPGLYTNAYIPTGQELAGNFSDFANTFVDPFPGKGDPITGGVIPHSRLTGDFAVFAWRISAVVSNSDTVHTTLVLANSLAYTYDASSVTIYGNVADATHGQTTGEVLGDGDSSKAFQKFTLHQSPVTYTSAATPAGAQSTLEVMVNEIDWNEANDFGILGPNDHEFVTQTDNSGITSVLFGNGEYGARVPSGTGNVKAVYRYGIGSPGNVDANTISQLATHPLGAQAVINPLPASGGADADSILQARQNTPLATKALDRLVSTQDYADFSRTYAGIGKASAARLSDGRRQVVYVTIAGAENIPIDVTSDLFSNLGQALLQFGDPHLPVALAVAQIKLLVMSAGFQVLPDYHFADVEPNVRAALLDAFSFDQQQLGQTIFLSQAVSIVQSVEGVDFCNFSVFDSVASGVTADQLTALAGTLTLRNKVTANLAQPNPAGTPTTQNPWARFTPAEIVFLTPDIADTLIMTEITPANPGPPAPKPKAIRTIRARIGGTI